MDRLTEAHGTGMAEAGAMFMAPAATVAASPDPLAGLRRPRILMRAARAGAADYDRNRDLRRLMAGRVPTPARAVAALIEAEALHEERRRAADAGYSLVRHVDLLIALLAEARLAATGA